MRFLSGLLGANLHGYSPYQHDFLTQCSLFNPVHEIALVLSMRWTLLSKSILLVELCLNVVGRRGGRGIVDISHGFLPLRDKRQ